MVQLLSCFFCFFFSFFLRLVFFLIELQSQVYHLLKLFLRVWTTHKPKTDVIRKLTGDNNVKIVFSFVNFVITLQFILKRTFSEKFVLLPLLVGMRLMKHPPEYNLVSGATFGCLLIKTILNQLQVPQGPPSGLNFTI